MPRQAIYTDIHWSEDDAKRFFSRINFHDRKGCWNWTGSHQRPGTTGQLPYGHFIYFDTVLGKSIQMSAHRASYMYHNGTIPPGLEVCHTCDVPYCVNPAHLWLGTHLENMKDAADKGRFGSRRPFRPNICIRRTRNGTFHVEISFERKRYVKRQKTRDAARDWARRLIATLTSNHVVSFAGMGAPRPTRRRSHLSPPSAR